MKKAPTIFVYNVLGRVAQTLPVQSLINNTRVLEEVNAGTLHLLPVLNFISGSIESRGEKLAFKLKSLIDSLGADQYNVVAFSLSGLDIRSSFDSNKELKDRLRRLITVGSPHNGSELALTGQIASYELAAKLSMLLGVHSTDIREITPVNMLNMNEAFEDRFDDRYFSVNSSCASTAMCELLRKTSDELSRTSELKKVFSDGLFYPDETTLHTRNVAEFGVDHQHLGVFSPAERNPVLDFVIDFAKSELI